MDTQSDILTAVSVLLCLAALGWCIALVRKVRGGPARYIVGLTGLLSVYHGARVLALAGVVEQFPPPRYYRASELAMTAMFLVSVAILEYYLVEYKRLQYKFRLLEASELPPPQRFVVADPHSAQVLYQAMSDSCPLPVVAVDPAGAVCYWNAAAESRLGWTRAEVIGKQPPYKVVKRSESTADAHVTRKDGKQVPCSLWTAPFQTTGAEIYGTLTIMGCRVATETGSRPVLPPQSKAGTPSSSCLADASCPA